MAMDGCMDGCFVDWLLEWREGWKEGWMREKWRADNVATNGCCRRKEEEEIQPKQKKEEQEGGVGVWQEGQHKQKKKKTKTKQKCSGNTDLLFLVFPHKSSRCNLNNRKHRTKAKAKMVGHLLMGWRKTLNDFAETASGSRHFA